MNTPQSLEAAVCQDCSAPASLEPLVLHTGAPHDSSTLEESEASYRYLFESNPHPMWIYDCDTLGFLLVNDAAIEHYGYSQEEFLAMTIKDIRPAEDVPIMMATRLPSGHKKGKRGVWRHKKKNDQVIDVEITVHDFRFQGRSARLALVSDITERIRVERALLQSEQEQRQLAYHLERERERLADAQAIAKVGSWELNLTTHVPVWSEETYRIFGVDRARMEASYEAFLDRVHPEDRAGVKQAYTESVANRTPYAINHRMQMEDGSLKIVYERGYTIYDADDRPIRSIGTVQDITDQKQAEQSLHRIMEGAHCLLWQAEVTEVAEALQWKMQFVSEPSAQRFLPLHVMEGEVYNDAWHHARPVEDRVRINLYSTQEIHAGRSYQQEFRSRSKDGVIHWLWEDVRVEVLGEGKWRCTGVCTDITERKRAEEATRAMTRDAQCLLWYAVVRNSPDGLLWDIEMPDEQAAQQFFPIPQPPGMLYTDAWVQSRWPEDSVRMDALGREALLTGQQGYTQQFRCRRADGEWRWLNETVRIETLEPGRWRCVGVCMDVTEQKRAEEERDRFFTAKQEADLANHAKSEFLSRMSHELRTPLNAILGFGQILERQTLTPLQEESVQYILKGGRHLLDLINEVLDIARVEAGHIELSLEPIPLAEIVAEACNLVRPLAAERNIVLHINDVGMERSHVLADRQRLKQVLINLLSNAIKYNIQGGKVKVACFPASDNSLRIAVQDTGWGITPEEQQKLFVPFERLDAARSGVEGTGLGLVLSQRLVTAMGGDLSFESLPGEGTTFFIGLPLALSPEERLADQLQGMGVPEPGSPAEQSATILTIEDNLSNLRLMEMLLRGRPGITLLAAMQGSIGLDLARQHEPDLILLDLNLPDISGREVLSRLQASVLTQDIPVIVLSADATPAQIERLMSAGASAYLTKPLDVTEFLHTLDTMLLNKKTEQNMLSHRDNFRGIPS